MAEEWAKTSIAMLTSQDGEALPLVLIEAFTAGVPAIAYDCHTGPAEIITDGVNGFLVEQLDVAGLADRLGQLMSSQDLLDQFGTAALDAAAEYDLDLVMGQWEELYAKLYARRGAPERLREKIDRVAGWMATTGGTGFAPAVPAPDSAMRGVAVQEFERRIAAANPDLARSSGFLALVSDTMRPADVRQSNLDFVVDALTEAGIDYQLVRDAQPRHRLALSTADRDRTLTVLAQAYRDQAVYCEMFTKSASMIGRTPLALLADRDTSRIGGLRVFRPVVSTSRTLRYNPMYGCDVEFWPESEDGMSLVPLRPTLLGAAVPKAAMTVGTTVVGERTYKSLDVLATRLINDIDFPIDVVYTWVDGDDPAWLARKNTVLAALGRPPVAAAGGDARFRSRDELRYSLRSIDMYGPWVRNIYIVTDDQTPAWLDIAHPRIRIVSHKEIFGSRGLLPTFNSHSIESQLHHIDGLAEHFLYFNDDVFFGRDVSPEQFFRSNGESLHFRSPTSVPMSPPSTEDDFNFSAGKNNRALLLQTFGRTLTHGFLHTPHALRKSVLNAIDLAYPADVARTAASQFRSTEDISIPSSLHHYYGFLTGQSGPGELKVTYVDLGDRDAHPTLTRILASRNFDTFCLNDTHHGQTSADEIELITRGFLRSYFPIRSQFEVGAD